MADRTEESQDSLSETLPEEARSKPTYKTADNTRNHYIELDALRGIAILGVFVAHSFFFWQDSVAEPVNIPFLGADLLLVGRVGGMGVALFFLLSGYLLIWTEERRVRDNTYSLRSYALRRAFRLIPAYYVALVFGFLAWSSRENALTFTDLLSHLTFMHSLFYPYHGVFDPILWSLTPEVVFYAVLPLLVLKIRGVYPRLALLGAGVLLAVLSAIYNSSPTLKWNPAAVLWVFLAGVMVRMLVERMQKHGRAFRFQAPLAVLLLALSAGLQLAEPLYEGFQGSLRVTLPILVLVFLAMGFALLLASPRLLALLRRKTLAFVGTISYSVFVLHNSILFLVFTYVLLVFKDPLKSWITQHGDLGAWAAFGAYFGITLLVTLAISYLSYRYIESPFLRQKPK